MNDLQLTIYNADSCRRHVQLLFAFPGTLVKNVSFKCTRGHEQRAALNGVALKNLEQKKRIL